MDNSRPSEPTGALDRRSVLRFGSIGLGATVLAACGSASTPTGISGDPVPTTDVPPVVPTTVPSAAQLENDLVQLRTASSLEILAADAYEEYGPLLTDAALVAEASRFAVDHRANADTLQAELSAQNDTDDRANRANEAVLAARIDPIESSLTVEGSAGDPNRISAFRDIERMLAATYVNAVGQHTEPSWRSRFAAHASAAARRAVVLDDGNGPTTALYPGVDLVLNSAFLGEALEEPSEEDGTDDAEAAGGSD